LPSRSSIVSSFESGRVTQKTSLLLATPPPTILMSAPAWNAVMAAVVATSPIGSPPLTTLRTVVPPPSEPTICLTRTPCLSNSPWSTAAIHGGENNSAGWLETVTSPPSPPSVSPESPQPASATTSASAAAARCIVSAAMCDSSPAPGARNSGPEATRQGSDQACEAA
jgi:hypothetical protein